MQIPRKRVHRNAAETSLRLLEYRKRNEKKKEKKKNEKRGRFHRDRIDGFQVFVGASA